MEIDVSASDLANLPYRVTVYKMGAPTLEFDGVVSYSLQESVLHLFMDDSSEELLPVRRVDRVSVCRLYHGKRILKVEDVPVVLETAPETAKNGKVKRNLIRELVGL